MLIGSWVGNYYWVVKSASLRGLQKSKPVPPLLTRLLKPPLFRPPFRVALLPFFKLPLREARPAFLDIRRALLR